MFPKKMSAGCLTRAIVSGTLCADLSTSAHFAVMLTQPSDASGRVSNCLPSLGLSLTFLSRETAVIVLRILYWLDQYPLNREALTFRDRFDRGF